MDKKKLNFLQDLKLLRRSKRFVPFRSSFSSKLKKKKKEISMDCPALVAYTTWTWCRATIREGITRGKIEIFHGRTDGSVDVFVEFVCVRRERSAQETRSLFARRYSPWKVNTPRSNSRAVALAKFQSWKRRFQRAELAKKLTRIQKFRRPNTMMH